MFDQHNDTDWNAPKQKIGLDKAYRDGKTVARRGGTRDECDRTGDEYEQWQRGYSYAEAYSSESW